MEPYYPFVVLALGVAFIIFCIVALRIHAFLALILAAIFVGIIADRAPDAASSSPQVVQALEVTTLEFGTTMGKIGVVIVLASIIGKCLMDSGAADKIVRRFLGFLSEKFSGVALLASGYVLSIPVFFDTVFYLLVPLAKSLRLRTGKNYLLYIMCVCAGGALTHSLVAPTPGPLVMTEELHLDLGMTILGGIAFSIIPAILGGWFFSKWMNSRMEIPLREVEGFSLADLQIIVDKPETELPPFWLSILPIALPVILIAGATILKEVDKSMIEAAAAQAPTAQEGTPAAPSENAENADEKAEGVPAWLLTSSKFLGNKNFALILATVLALYLMIRQKGLALRELSPVLEPAIASAGVICLITSAGGAFGAMIKKAGVGDAVSTMLPEQASGTLLLLVAFGIASVMKIAQGSGTVAMITASGIMWNVIGNEDGTLKMDLPYHVIYIYLAVGFGSKPFSWMNDSGFWIVSKMSGFTEKETLKTWTMLLAVLGFIGLIQILILSQPWLLPLK